MIILSRRAFLILIVLVFFLFGSSAAIGVYSYRQGRAIARLQQESIINRVDLVARICDRANRDTLDNIELLRRVNPKVLNVARSIYRLEPDCYRYAESIVRPPPGAVPTSPLGIPPLKP